MCFLMCMLLKIMDSAELFYIMRYRCVFPFSLFDEIDCLVYCCV